MKNEKLEAINKELEKDYEDLRQYVENEGLWTLDAVAVFQMEREANERRVKRVRGDLN